MAQIIRYINPKEAKGIASGKWQCVVCGHIHDTYDGGRNCAIADHEKKGRKTT